MDNILKVVKLKSGMELKINPAPFEVSESLFRAISEEMKNMKIESELPDVNFFKDIFCQGISSDKIRACTWACMDHALYNGLRITKDTFTPVAAREDYLEICFEVVKENIAPFTKNLYAQFSQVVGILKKSLLS